MPRSQPAPAAPEDHLRKLVATVLAALAVAAARPARADGLGANADSVYLVGVFVDPVCVYQHGMTGVDQKACAMVPGRVDQGMAFLDLRRRRLFTVIGMTHTQNPRQAFLDLLGDTVAVSARLWKAQGSYAIAVNGVWPVDHQPRPAWSWWPVRWHLSTLEGCALLAALYLLAAGPLRRKLGGPERFEIGRATAFLLSLVVVVGSLNGPLHDLSDLYLFSTHMVQHLLLAQLFPPLFIFGLSPWLMAWLLRNAGVRGAWRFLAGVPMGFILYSIVFSIWHLPPLYNLMMRAHGFHVAMHLMVMGTAVLMWWPILGNAPGMPRMNPPLQMLYLLLLSTPMTAVGAAITFAARPLYEWYALAPRVFDMTALDDQKLGALIMWIPGTLFYWLILSAIFLRWATREAKTGDAVLPKPA